MAKLIHYFIPHSENNHKPYLTRNPGLVTILIFMLSIQTTLNVFFSSRPQILGFATSIYQQELVSLTNQQRQDAGLPTLIHNTKLDQAATLKAQDMFADDYWAHVSPDGVEPWHWFSVVGYNYLAAGENLARDFDTSAGVVSAWMSSPSHRDNILYTNFTEIGIAVVNGNINGEDTTLVVQLFATPISQPNIVPVENPSPTTIPTVIPTTKPTAIPTKVVVPTSNPNPTRTIYPTATPTLNPTETPTPSPTLIPTLTPTPTPEFVYNDNSKTTILPLINQGSNPLSPFQVNLEVLKNLNSYSISRIISLIIISILMFTLISESAILKIKGIQHAHTQKLIHVGILLLTLLGTIYGAGGSIL